MSWRKDDEFVGYPRIVDGTVKHGKREKMKERRVPFRQLALDVHRNKLVTYSFYDNQITVIDNLALLSVNPDLRIPFGFCARIIANGKVPILQSE
jgi:hypothetical protein